MNLKLVLNSLKSDRRELDVPTSGILGFSALLTVAVYLLLLPVRSSYVGTLVYDRGFTQILVIAFASFVLAFLGLKVRKIQQELRGLKKDYFPATNHAFKPSDQAISLLQDQLGKENNLLARRCGRVLGAYIYSRSRQIATDFAIEDANFYQSKSESSYLLPRILIWAIPLLGFIGTVMGISAAVNGFSRFLSQSSDVAQIKEGIGTVTSGLAIAFDTTLLALLISVVVMIPLVLVERMEAQLLMGIDIYINDKILPRFKDRTGGASLDPEEVREVIDQSLAAALPTPEALIEPADTYAKTAVEKLTEQFIQQLQPLESQVQSLLTSLETLQQGMQADRQEFLTRIPDTESLMHPARTYAEQAVQALTQNFTEEVQPLHAQVQGLLTSVETLQQGMQADRQDFLERIPDAEALIQPAHTYATQAVQTLTQSFTQEVQPLQVQVQGLLSQIEILRETLQGDRQLLQGTVQELVTTFEARIPSAEALVQPAQAYAEQAAKDFVTHIGNDMSTIQTQVQQIIRQFDILQVNLREDRESLNTGLQQAAGTLQERVEQLARHSAKINEVTQLQTSLEQTLKTLKEKATLEAVLGEVQQTLQKLQPSLEQMSKPRRIMLLEQDEAVGGKS